MVYNEEEHAGAAVIKLPSAKPGLLSTDWHFEAVGGSQILNEAPRRLWNDEVMFESLMFNDEELLEKSIVIPIIISDNIDRKIYDKDVKEVNWYGVIGEKIDLQLTPEEFDRIWPALTSKDFSKRYLYLNVHGSKTVQTWDSKSMPSSMLITGYHFDFMT